MITLNIEFIIVNLISACSIIKEACISSTDKMKDYFAVWSEKCFHDYETQGQI
jgi:hypothetical protein